MPIHLEHSSIYVAHLYAHNPDTNPDLWALFYLDEYGNCSRHFLKTYERYGDSRARGPRFTWYSIYGEYVTRHNDGDVFGYYKIVGPDRLPRFDAFLHACRHAHPDNGAQYTHDSHWHQGSSSSFVSLEKNWVLHVVARLFSAERARMTECLISKYSRYMVRWYRERGEHNRSFVSDVAKKVTPRRRGVHWEQ